MHNIEAQWLYCDGCVSVSAVYFTNLAQRHRLFMYMSLRHSSSSLRLFHTPGLCTILPVFITYQKYASINGQIERPLNNTSHTICRNVYNLHKGCPTSGPGVACGPRCHFMRPGSGLVGVLVSVIATGSKGRGFKRDRGDRFLRAIKIRSTPSFGWEVKPEVPCRKMLRHVKDPLRFFRY
jgi:hypothetical protein